MSSWFSLHTHSQFSTLDGMTRVPELVRKAARDGRPALGLTDHGNMAGTTQLYKACKAEGIMAFPGLEAYIADPNVDDPYDAKTARFHLCLNALDLAGYQALVKYNSLSHTRPRFSRFPRLLMSDLAALGKEAGEHVSITTGCFFGLVQQTLVGELTAPGKPKPTKKMEATRIIKTLASWFPHTIVEVQNHHITHDEHDEAVDDATMVATLFAIAKELGLPVLATQDSHYTEQRQREAHALMKKMVYGGADDAFPGDSFHLASADWVKEHYTRSQWARVEEGAKYLLDLNKLKIPALDKFTAQVPVIEVHADAVLRKMTARDLRRYVGSMPLAKVKRYQDRLTEELRVIGVVGVANYFLLVKEVVQYCHDNDIAVEARGSANGSLVCFLMGITQIDPLEWKIPFERFLSEDRIKPPDIDLDVETSRRQEILAWLRNRFRTVSIGTWAELGVSIDVNTGEQIGSVFRTFQAHLRNRAMQEATDALVTKQPAGAKPITKAALEAAGRTWYARKYGHIQTMEDVRTHLPGEYPALLEIATLKSVYKSYGVHAGGVLLGTEDFPIEKYVPTMLVASSDTTASQFPMDDIDEWGMLKLDVLGQQTLTVMRRCQAMAGIDNPTDFSWIPNDDPQACALLREGRTDNGIFHFEGYTKAKGGRELGIRNTRDVVLATAIYMPGATDGGAKDEYLRRRKAGRHMVPSFHPVFDSVLAETYGVMVYQDQPLSVLRAMGMSIESINAMYKILKDSGKGAIERNNTRLATLREEFDYLCTKHGIEENDEAWSMVTSFNAYGMNKAHAAGYGVRSYRCAYLKAHYPLEFMTALLEAWAGSKKEKPYEREARRLKFRLLPPDVNLSGATWTIVKKREAIRRGLVSIKGIGWELARGIASEAPFEDVEDLATRARPNGRVLAGAKQFLADTNAAEYSGVLATLDDVGALDSLK